MLNHGHQARADRFSWVRSVASATLVAAVMLCASSVVSAQALDVLHAFAGGSTEPVFPVAGLTIGTDGNFYGTTSAGGANGFGTVFKMSPAGVVATLYSFRGGSGSSTDSGGPMTELVQGTDGFFYGTTSGFINAAVIWGTVFRVSVDGVESRIVSFEKGTSPHRAALIQNPDGSLYSTFINTGLCAVLGAPMGALISIPGCAAGTLGALVRTADGDFYGTSSRGGAFDRGIVFRWNTTGAVIVHAFAGGAEGAAPRSLILGADGNFYGTTESGGAFNQGTIFKMTPGGAATVLYSFAGGADGRGPSWPLIQATDGDFYGTAPGGAFDQGVAFKMTPTGDFIVLHTFNGAPSDGAQPQSRLLQTADGTFHGTTTFGGISNLGTVFTMTPSGTVTVRFSFGAGVDGTLARAPLVQASDGNFYGTTAAGGLGQGTVFQVTPAGQTRTIHTFTGGSADGAAPVAGLIQASDGNFYGTTPSGGGSGTAGGAGTVFKLTPTGAVTLLHAFVGGSTDGAQPVAALVEAGDGTLLGTTVSGGAFGLGTAFRITPKGTFSIVHDFFFGSAGGAEPRAALIKATDGHFYGTTSRGGAFNRGTLFRLTAAGSFTVLHAFSGGADGATPLGSLVQASDGHLYGTTSANGASNRGTVFRVTLTGAFTTLHGLQSSEGGTSLAGLVQAADGFLYGTTSTGGAFNSGTVFRLTLNGDLTVVAAPAAAEGVGPNAPLIQAADGFLYGTTAFGGAFGNGVVFRVAIYATPTPPLAVVVATAAQIRLTWSSVATAASYTVKRVAASGATTVVASGLTATTFVDLAVTNGQTYRYVVAAVNAAGEGLASYEVSMTAGRGARGDFDGNGRADVTVFRPSTGTWYIRGVGVAVWGGGADIPVPGDYDGDMRADLAVYRPSSGVWYIVRSSVGVGSAVSWGGGADVPVPADYDGDGTTDVAVFRPATGEWFILQSRTQTGRVVVWGGGADVPVARDYDGDGSADIAVFRPSTGAWFILQSSTQTGRVTVWGGGADIPAAADYDGDGKADVAVFRRLSSASTWFILRSSTQTGSTTSWGAAADIPVAADYDGDGRTDIAVFRPSTGAWYLLQSMTAGTLVIWGSSSDIPVLKQPGLSELGH